MDVSGISIKDGTIPKTKKEYWQTKLLRNQERDARHIRELRKQGWKVMRLWECEIEKKPDWIKNKLYKSLQDAQNTNSGSK
jgi:DNA mismatch endonuclease (patch repair protein)